MRIQVLESPAELAVLSDGYDAALPGESAPPFCTHRWLSSWWSAHRERQRIRVWCALEGSRLHAAIPLLYTTARYGGARLRRVSCLGKYWGIFDLPLRDDGGEVAAAFLDWLHTPAAGKWDVLRLGPHDPASPALAAFRGALDARGVRHRTTEVENPYLTLPGSWEEFLAARSKNFRRTVKKKANGLAERGLRVEYVEEPGEGELERSLFAVSERSWQGGEGVAIAATPEGRAFYRAVAARRDGFQASVCVVWDGERAVGYLWGARRGAVYHAYDTGYDPEYADWSPGLVMHYRVLEELCARGVGELNFGYAHGYKDRFDPESYFFSEVTAFRTPVIAGLSRLVERARAVLGR